MAKPKFKSSKTSNVDRDLIGEPLRIGINPAKKIQEQVDNLDFLEVEVELTLEEELINTLMAIPKVSVRKLGSIIAETKKEENYTDKEMPEETSTMSKEKNDMLKAIFSNLEL